MTNTVKIGKGHTLDKRFRLPGVVLQYHCPDCGHPGEWNGNNQYLSYPQVGVSEEITGFCVECDHNWSLGTATVEIQVHIEKA